MIQFLETSVSAELPSMYHLTDSNLHKRGVGVSNRYTEISHNFIPLSAGYYCWLQTPLTPGQEQIIAPSCMHSLIVEGSQFHTPIDLLGELKERLHASPSPLTTMRVALMRSP
ncbi:hypothetical protein CDAR_303611 [Caerostris darwini]|uniref:Uncharacterized protein n=1 Tax=Caerostris darwini TaxID=1538125 RepID=A0AAV4UYY5_9ARAC|nr:hypothetical protein CDAR_303611 [Caerostris darwini]